MPIICAKRMFTVHLFFRFNAFGSLYSTLISCIIYLLKLKTRERYILQSEANKFFSTENKHKTLAGLKTIESFVLEDFVSIHQRIKYLGLQGGSL